MSIRQLTLGSDILLSKKKINFHPATVLDLIKEQDIRDLTTGQEKNTLEKVGEGMHETGKGLMGCGCGLMLLIVIILLFFALKFLFLGAILMLPDSERKLCQIIRNDRIITGLYPSMAGLERRTGHDADETRSGR